MQINQNKYSLSLEEFYHNFDKNVQLLHENLFLKQRNCNILKILILWVNEILFHIHQYKVESLIRVLQKNSQL